MNETFLVDQKYDFKSHKVSNFISTMFKAVDSSTVCVFLITLVNIQKEVKVLSTISAKSIRRVDL